MIQMDGPCRGTPDTRQNSQQGGLARSAGSDDSRELTGARCEPGIAKDGAVPGVHCHVLGGESAARLAGNPAKGKTIEDEGVLFTKIQPVADEELVPVEKAPVGEES